MKRKRSHTLGRVARRVIAKRTRRGFGGFDALGRSLETIALRTPPASARERGSFDEALARWMAQLQSQLDARTGESITTIQKREPGFFSRPGVTDHFLRRRVVAEKGPKYVRIVTRDVNKDGSLGGGSATAFVEKTTGNIYKPASFKGPTRNFIRGNIFNLTKPPRTNY